MPIERVLIAIATFRRPAQLRRLLNSLRVTQSGGLSVAVVVVDNDRAESAREICTEFAGILDIEYSVQHVPGIADTRNAALAHASAHDAVIFVDDDEWVASDWLARLVERADNTNADVVTGPVITERSALPSWARRGAFFQRRSIPDGEVLATAATNNTLLRVASWEQAGSPRFDRAYSFSGGSDTALFSYLVRRHRQTIVYCENAVVFEDLPEERVTLRWVTRRELRTGSVLFRVWVPYDGVWRCALRMVLHMAYGVGNLAINLIFRWRLSAYGYSKLMRGIGMLNASRGVIVEEYARSH